MKRRPRNSRTTERGAKRSSTSLEARAAPCAFPISAALGLIAAVVLFVVPASPVSSGPGGELRFSLHGEPKTLDPLLMADEHEEAVRYLTEGVLIRINRLTQQPEPELATSWKVSRDGRQIVMQLRRGVTFPDGSAFNSADVVHTFQCLLDTALHSAIADSFKTGKGTIKVSAEGFYTVIAEFPTPVSQIERMFDQVAILSAHATKRPAPGLGPFLIAERKPGVAILLKRNPTYWKRDADGKRLPRVDSIRLDIQQNRDLELVRFLRGDVGLIDKLTPELYERLKVEAPNAVIDAGPTLDTEFLWFNMSAQMNLPEYKREWFRSAPFRRAISQAVHRADLCRVVYRGHASPAAGLLSPANRLWFKQDLIPDTFDPAAALKRLAAAGFALHDRALRDRALRDRAGNAVEFSIITNSGNETRERMAVMIQQDLAALGMKVNVVTLDFPSLLDRITRTLDYEACLLGLTNIDPDPSGLMNVLLSSASNHPWDPAEKRPQTEWEAEIDRLMLAQASTADYRRRKQYVDRVQQILHDQAPLIYLLHPNALSAVSTHVAGVKPSAFFPHTFWDAEHLALK